MKMNTSGDIYYQPCDLSAWKTFLAHGTTRRDTDAYYASSTDRTKIADAFGEPPDWADHVMWRVKK